MAESIGQIISKYKNLDPLPAGQSLSDASKSITNVARFVQNLKNLVRETTRTLGSIDSKISENPIVALKYAARLANLGVVPVKREKEKRVSEREKMAERIKADEGPPLLTDFNKVYKDEAENVISSHDSFPVKKIPQSYRKTTTEQVEKDLDYSDKELFKSYLEEAKKENATSGLNSADTVAKFFEGNKDILTGWRNVDGYSVSTNNIWEITMEPYTIQLRSYLLLS